MNIKIFRYYQPSCIIGLVLILGGLIVLANKYLGLSLAIMGTITFIFGIIDKYGWKYLPFLFWIPNMEGRYEGTLSFSFRDDHCQDQKGQLKHVKIIHQTGSTITINSFTYKPDGTRSSPSISKDISVEVCKDGTYQLIYTYLNEGSTVQNFPPHYGTEIIKFIKNDRERNLSGRYYTERLPFQTKGEFIEMKYINNDLTHNF